MADDKESVQWVRDLDTPLSHAHREYLLNRHGSYDLDPVPDPSDADPLNWPYWRKVINLALVAFHAMMSSFTAAAIQDFFADIAVELGVSIQTAIYLISMQIAVQGLAPLLWIPISDRYGRRPVFLVSLVCSLAGNIGCAESPSYATMAVCRCITAFAICPAQAVRSAVVVETFFRPERARYMGVWTLMVTLGVPTAPFLFGFVGIRIGYRWIYWILAITNAVQLILYACLGRETRYLRSPTQCHETPSTSALFRFHRIDSTPPSLLDFVRPLYLAWRACVVIPTAAYAMVFLWQIMINLEIPQVFVVKFGLNTQQIGLQSLAVMIGSVLGEVSYEFRLWLAYPGFALAIAGVIVFLVQIARAGSQWDITPLVGSAISAAGNQIVTTILVTYAVDCYREEAANIGVFVNFVRNIWGFIGPFWFNQMIAATGFSGSSGIATAMVVAVSYLPTMLLQWKGLSWRKGKESA